MTVKTKRTGRSDCLTMRIKKQYFDSVLSGDKTKEYRDFKPYYKRLLIDNKDPVNYLYLHYQNKIGLVVKVKSIKVIKTPEHLKGTGINFSSKVFEIALGKSTLIQ